jgi:hypothetical protein
MHCKPIQNPFLFKFLVGLALASCVQAGITYVDWSIRAGFASNPGANTIFSAADATADLGGANAAIPAVGLTHSTPPTIFAEGGRSLLAGFVGNFIASAGGEIAVFIDDLPAATTVRPTSKPPSRRLSGGRRRLIGSESSGRGCHRRGRPAGRAE